MKYKPPPDKAYQYEWAKAKRLAELEAENERLREAWKHDVEWWKRELDNVQTDYKLLADKYNKLVK